MRQDAALAKLRVLSAGLKSTADANRRRSRAALRTKKAASKQEKTPTLTRRTSTRLRGAQAPATRPLEAVPEDEAASEGEWLFDADAGAV